MIVDAPRLRHAIGAAGLVVLAIRFAAVQFPQERERVRELAYKVLSFAIGR